MDYKELEFDDVIILYQYKKENDNHYMEILVDEYFLPEEEIEEAYKVRINEIFKNEGAYFHIDTDKFPIENIIAAVSKENFAYNQLDRLTFGNSVDNSEYFIKSCFDENYENVCVNEVCVVLPDNSDYILTFDKDTLNIPINALEICGTMDCPVNVREMSVGYATNNEVKEYHMCDMEDYYRIEAEIDDFITCMERLECYHHFESGNEYINIETDFEGVEDKNLRVNIYVGDNSSVEFISKLSEYVEEFEEKNPNLNPVLDAKDFFRGLSEKFDKVEYDDYTKNEIKDIEYDEKDF